MEEALKDQLLDQLYITHAHAARRNNTSTQVLVAAFESNGGNLLGAISAALMCLGGAHAPIKQVYQLFNDLNHHRPFILPERVAGFGSSFVKGKHDPMLDNLRKVCQDLIPEYINHGNTIQRILHDRGKMLYPNLAFYTAAISHALEEGETFCQTHLVQSRISVWIEILKSRQANG